MFEVETLYFSLYILNGEFDAFHSLNYYSRNYIFCSGKQEVGAIQEMMVAFNFIVSDSTRKLQDVLTEFCGSNTTPSGAPKYHPDGVSLNQNYP